VAPHGFPSVRVALAILVAVNAVMAFWTHHQYQRMLNYCAGFSRPGLECLTGNRAQQLGQAIFFEVGVWLVLELGGLVLLGAAIMNRRRSSTDIANLS
jgi:hypothetical protein